MINIFKYSKGFIVLATSGFILGQRHTFTQMYEAYEPIGSCFEQFEIAAKKALDKKEIETRGSYQ